MLPFVIIYAEQFTFVHCLAPFLRQRQRPRASSHNVRMQSSRSSLHSVPLHALNEDFAFAPSAFGELE